MRSIARPAGLTLLLAGLGSCGGGPGGTTGPVGTKLVFGTVQDSVSVNTAFSPPITVEVHDANGAVVTGSSAHILLYIRPVDPQPLSGTLSLQADRGIATFSDLIIDSVGTYQIVAKSGGLDSAVSIPITSHPPPPPPSTIEITVSGVGAQVQFRSIQNHSLNPAVDTLLQGGTAHWIWAGGTHGVHSTGDPTFQDSDTSSVVTHEYVFTFNNPGSFFYQCLIHGAAMTGKILVVPPVTTAPGSH